MSKWIVLMLAGLAASHVQADTKIINDRFYVDGQPFFVRGMVYAPEPRGWPKAGVITYGNEPYAWLCGKTQASDWQSVCYDDDLTGTASPGTAHEDHNYNLALKKRWQRDLDELKKMGVNTIRLYNVNNHNKKHAEFLTEVNQRQMKVLYPALTDYASKQPIASVTSIVTGIVNETCRNPAILAYIVGNEFDADILANPNGPRAQAVRKAAEIVHKQCAGALTTYAVADSGWQPDGSGKSRLFDALGADNIDFFTVNSGYRGDPSPDGNDQGKGAQGAYDRLFKDMQGMSAAYRKPFLIGEAGVHDIYDSAYRRNWYDYVWGMTLGRSRAANNNGVVFFEFNDEPLKKIGTNDMYMGVTTAKWPKALKPDDFNATGELDNELKTGGYTGIATFNDGTKTIDFKTLLGRDSRIGSGRYEMFVNDGKGAGACNYVYSPDPETINSECQKELAKIPAAR